MMLRVVDIDEEQEAQQEILHRRLLEMRDEFGKQLWDWHDKLKRLRHRVCKVPNGSKYRSEFEEASSATLLVALQLKSHVLTNLLLNRLPMLPDQSRQYQLVRFFSDSIIPLRDAVFDRHSVGLGVLQLAVDEEGNIELRHISPEDLLFDTRRGFRELHRCIRRIQAEDGELYEYFDANSHILFTDKEIVSVQPNPLNRVPIYLLPAILPGKDIYPIADGELALPQQQLLDEIRRTLLDSARRGRPILEYRVGDIEEAELSALESGESVVVGTASGQGLHPVAMPISTTEWTALEQLARQDLDTMLGISDILRSTLTSTDPSRKIDTATQAQIEAQLLNARLAADSVELESAVHRITDDWHILQFNEPAFILPQQPSTPEPLAVASQNQPMTQVQGA